jgi:hypothetical protein
MGHISFVLPARGRAGGDGLSKGRSRQFGAEALKGAPLAVGDTVFSEFLDLPGERPLLGREVDGISAGSRRRSPDWA